MIFLFFGAILLSSASVILWKREMDIVKCAAFGTCFYFMTYVLVTAGLFFFESFSLLWAAVITFVISSTVAAYSLVHNKGREAIVLKLEWRIHGAAYLLTLILVLSLGVPFGYFGMGQDQGVYQTEAINLIYGKNEWHTTISEYKDIDDEEYKEYFYDSVKAVLGLNFIESRYSSIVSPDDPEALEGIYHGLPTFPATLALAGKLFGMEHMMLFQAIFYAISLLLIEYILSEQKVAWWVRAILLGVYGISPQVMWIAKSAFTESFLAVLVLLYLYFMLKSDVRLQALSVLPIVVFCFFHISAFSMFPVFLVNYWFMYFVRKDTRYIRLAVISSIGLIIALVMEFVVVPIYTINNFAKLFEEHGINLEMKGIPFVMIVGALAFAILSEGMRLLNKVRYRDILICEKILFFVLTVIMIAFFAYGKSYFGYQNFPRLIGDATITAYATLSGFFLLPIICVYHIFSIRHEHGEDYYILSNFFIYAIIIYSMVFRPMVLSNYYYNTRYLMPYLAVIIVLYGAIYKEFCGQQNKIINAMNAVMLAAPFVGICIMLPFASVVRSNQDDTNVQWNTLADIFGCVKSSDIVFVDEDEMMWFYYPLRATGAHIYPIKSVDHFTEDWWRNIGEDKKAYYLSQSQVYEDDWQYEIAYEDRSTFQLNDGGAITRVIFWPKDFTQKGERTHILYRVTAVNPIIDASSGYFISGWSNNASGHRWMNDKTAKLYVYLEKENYKMHVYFGDRIPFDLIDLENILLEVYLNNHLIEKVNIGAKNDRFEIDISADYLNEGKNILEFRSNDFWSPSEYGSQDLSNYIFSIDLIKFLGETRL